MDVNQAEKEEEIKIKLVEGEQEEPPSVSVEKTDLEPPWRNLPKPESEISIEAGLDERYEVLCRLGEGGMGNVYKVMDKIIGKVFAIKVLRSDLSKDKNVVSRFKQEALAASRLTHINLASVYSSGESRSGAPYLVMDFLEGKSLEEILAKEGHLEPQKANNIFIEICEALEHAHSKGIIHRDLKPGNVIIVDGDERVKIVDFGIAKILPKPGVDTLKLTYGEEVLGSPIYMSPEQCKGDKLDVRSDIYSFGCLMYEVVCGRPPFLGDNPIKTILMHLNEPPANLNMHLKQAELPRGLDYVILKCMQKDPKDRYQSVFELRMDLLGVKDNKPPKQKMLNRKSRWMAHASTAFLAAVVFVFGFEVVSSYLNPDQNRRPLSFTGLAQLFNLKEPPAVVASNPGDAALLDQYNERIEAAVRAYPRDEKELAAAEFDMTTFLVRRSDFANAELHCRRVMDVLNSIEDPILLARYQYTMGYILERERRFPDAIRYYDNAIAAMTAAFGDDNPITGLAHNRLAISFERNRYNNEAENEYEQSFEIFRINFGPNSSEVKTVLQNMVAYYKHRRMSSKELSMQNQLDKISFPSERRYNVESRENPSYMASDYARRFDGKLEGER